MTEKKKIGRPKLYKEPTRLKQIIITNSNYEYINYLSKVNKTSHNLEINRIIENERGGKK